MCVYKCVREPDFKGPCRECGSASDGHKAAVFFTDTQTNKLIFNLYAKTWT